MKNTWIIVLLFGWCRTDWFVETAVSETSKLWNATYLDKLKRDLLMTYDKYARPDNHYNKTTVNISLAFIHFDLDEAKSVLHTHCWTRVHWTDSKLKWNASNYGNLTVIPLAPHEVWQPDINLSNSASANNIDYFGSTYVLSYGDGTLLWVPPTHFRAFCALDLHYWPYDKHECQLVLESWAFSSGQLDLELRESGYELDELQLIKNEWQVVNVSAERRTHPGPYTDIVYKIILERNSPMYRTVFTGPAVVIILLTLATFCLPAHQGGKILLNGINAIMIVMFLMYFARKLNVMAFHTPLIVTFYSNTLYLVCFSTLISVLVINFTRTNHTTAVPWIIKKQLDGPLEKYLFLQHVYSAKAERQSRSEVFGDPPFDEHGTTDDQQTIRTRGERSALQNEWIKLAVAIDRIAFITYTLIFALSAIIFPF